MTQATTEKKQWPKKTVLATVESVGKDKSGEHWLLGLRIPSFKSEYPIIIYNLSEEQVKPFKIGETYSLALTQENLKTGKDGQPKNAGYPANYFYGLVGIAEPAATETAPTEYDGQGQVAKPPQRQQQPRDTFQEAADARQVSIERQSTLTNAVTLCVARGTLTNEEVKECHDYLYSLLHGAPATDQLTQFFGPPQSSAPAPEASAKAEGAKRATVAPSEPTFANVGDLLTRAQKTYGMLRPAVYAVLGVGGINGITDYPKAWAMIVASREKTNA